MPYQDLSFEASPPQEDPTWVLLPTIYEVQKGVPVPLEKNGNQAASAKGSQVSEPYRSLFTPHIPWFPLSIAPSLTRTDLLKFVAYAAFFFLVLLYPFEDTRTNKAEKRFFRSVLLMVLLSGVIVAMVGFLERFTWNGKL
ncbi:MAG: hypothetical protein O7B35_18085, partial [Deltaproteobacteria bacterium]|nr:hypothetical protein [Deltaproteobacteria bacterium]